MSFFIDLQLCDYNSHEAHQFHPIMPRYAVGPIFD
jgi:hypothetical protein